LAAALNPPAPLFQKGERSSKGGERWSKAEVSQKGESPSAIHQISAKPLNHQTVVLVAGVQIERNLHGLDGDLDLAVVGLSGSQPLQGESRGD